MTKTERTIAAIIAEQALLDPEQITPEADLDTLGVDSLALVESIFAIEEAFDIHVPFNANTPEESDFDISNLRTISKAVERLIAQKTA